MSAKVCRQLGIECDAPDLTAWKSMTDKIKNLKNKVKIALAGKYVALHDAYLSVAEALHHGGYDSDAEVKIDWINAEYVTAENVDELLKEADGVLVPGGFGDRGIEGKILAIKYARENNVPFLTL